jgi:hypothetical protein
MFNKLEARVLSEYKRSRAAPSTFCTLIKHYFSLVLNTTKLSLFTQNSRSLASHVRCFSRYSGRNTPIYNMFVHTYRYTSNHQNIAFWANTSILIYFTIQTTYFNGLLTERRAWGLYCEISDRGFLVWTERRRSMQKTEVWYFTVKTEQARSVIGLLIIIWLSLWQGW